MIEYYDRTSNMNACRSSGAVPYTNGGAALSASQDVMEPSEALGSTTSTVTIQLASTNTGPVAFCVVLVLESSSGGIVNYREVKVDANIQSNGSLALEGTVIDTMLNIPISAPAKNEDIRLKVTLCQGTSTELSPGDVVCVEIRPVNVNDDSTNTNFHVSSVNSLAYTSDFGNGNTKTQTAVTSADTPDQLSVIGECPTGTNEGSTCVSTFLRADMYGKSDDNPAISASGMAMIAFGSKSRLLSEEDNDDRHLAFTVHLPVTLLSTPVEGMSGDSGALLPWVSLAATATVILVLTNT